MKHKKFYRSSAHLPVRNLKATLDFYRDILGFSEEWIWENKDGGIQRDELRILFGEDPEYVSILNNTNHRLNLIWFVDGIDEIFLEFKERGIEIVSVLKGYPYGLKEFSFVDINGYYIRVAESIEEK